jgi:hypothetical protein
MYIPDLTPIDHAQLIAVGWLSGRYNYTRGPVKDAFVQALFRALKNPWQPAANGGHHQCEFCRITGGPRELEYGGITISVGNANLYVPAPGYVFCAPSLIAHYIDAHEYAPPDAFQQAVIECPPMCSIPYLRAVLTSGPPDIVPRSE